MNDTERPIRFIYCDESGKLQMDEEAVSFLQLLKEPIGVVSVCGPPRNGKSYILNRILGRSNGFQMSSTMSRCTKGLWLWNTSLRRTADDGTKYNLLLIDSEGIGASKEAYFYLVVLLSSMLIYNQMGEIDDCALGGLSLVTKMTNKHTRVEDSLGKNTTFELGQISPVFVWLLRIREPIQALFPDRDCFTLVWPLVDENELQRLDQISIDELRPEFKSGVDEFIRFVFERTKPKKVGPTVMTGPIFVGIAQSFLDAFNNGGVPTITSLWQSVEETERLRHWNTNEVCKSSPEAAIKKKESIE